MVFVLSGPPQRNRRPWAHRAFVPFGMRRLVQLGPELPAAPAIERRFGADNAEKSMRQQLTRFGLAAGLLAGTTCVALAQGSSSPSASSGSSSRDCTRAGVARPRLK